MRYALGLLLSLLLSETAMAAVTLQALGTDPSSPATLANSENLYVRVAYDTDRPIRIRGDAFAGGKQVTSMTSGSYLHGPGQGEAMFWFAYTTPIRIDQIRLWAEEEGTRRPPATTLDVPVDVTWTGERSAVVRERPEWVQRMNAETARRQKAAYDAYMSRPTPWWEVVLFFALGWSIPLYFVVQTVMLWRYRGGWRVAAAIPAVPMALVLAHAVWAFSKASNLFPLGLIFTAAPALIYLLIVMAVRRSRPRATLLALVVIGWPLVVTLGPPVSEAQVKSARIGFLGAASLSADAIRIEASRSVLRELTP